MLRNHLKANALCELGRCPCLGDRVNSNRRVFHGLSFCFQKRITLFTYKPRRATEPASAFRR